MLKLQHVDSPARYVKLTSLPVSIGRDEGNHMVLDAQGVSDFHAEIDGDDGELYITDLLSASGTLVNDQRLVERTRLKPWDVIRIGTVDMEINDPNTCRPGSWVLRTESDLLSSQFYTLLEKTVVGRDPECDLTIDWYLLSRRHAELLVEEDHLRVIDLDSRNGTFVNGERIQDTSAWPGDEIRFDEQRFVVVGPSRAEVKHEQDDDRTQLRVEEDPDRTQIAPAKAPVSGVGVREVEPPEEAGQGSDDEETRFMMSAVPEEETRIFVAGNAPVPTRPDALLVLDFGSRKGERHALDSDVQCIGRAPGNELVLEESGVSKQHAEIFCTAGQWHIRDLKSRNGTQVNGLGVEEALLQSGDRIALGKAELLFQCEVVSVEPTGAADTYLYQAAQQQPRNAAVARVDAGNIRLSGTWLWGGLALLLVLAGVTALYGSRAGWF